MYDGSGFVQFIKGIAEIAQGATKPSILPLCCRELLCARDPPRVTCIHHEYKQLPLQDDNKNVFFKPSHASFFFGSKEIDALRCLFPLHVAQSSSTFDVLSACLWRCYTAALHRQNPNQEVRFMCAVNARFQPCSGESYFVPYTNSKGEHGTVVLICLPEEGMERFEKELNGMVKIKDEEKTIKLMSNL
ncbi:benzyl alcohol O-benzoyltransferase-like [Arachis ipaensis]|uniref:benzyl alcohol O-benzoyltransferase-like n=1 Tax=Arachis ipaensis TaxID=130454 RepID=UPI000A2B3A10|nr:benzyl alcohol O-benzoyltransferase-like [Arachis ipaensis]